jgi:hypothetical protein
VQVAFWLRDTVLLLYIVIVLLRDEELAAACSVNTPRATATPIINVSTTSLT